MRKNYEIFWAKDKDMSLDFLKEIGLQKENISLVDQWFFDYLEFHSASNSFEDGMKYENELRLRHQLFSEQENQSNKYFLGKLIKYHNISNSGFLRSTSIARLGVVLRDLITEYVDKKKVTFLPLEFVALTDYLQCSDVSPNGELIENILKIESKNKICKKATISEKNNILRNILCINSNKGFHHDIRDYKKILRLIDANDSQLIHYIYQYRVQNEQGCYQILNTVFEFQLFTDRYEDFATKREIINCFDSSTGKTPKENWIIKMEGIKIEIGYEKLGALCIEIMKQNELRNYHFEYTHWSDDVVKRFMKSAKWTNDLIEK